MQCLEWKFEKERKYCKKNGEKLRHFDDSFQSSNIRIDNIKEYIKNTW